MRSDAYLFQPEKATSQDVAINNVAGQKRCEQSRIAALLKNVSDSLLYALSGSNEPRIWQTSDRRGNVIWHVYDREKGFQTSFSSEEEVRSWLDQRYNF